MSNLLLSAVGTAVTIAIAVLAVGLVVFAVWYQIRCKKKGKGSCGCDCSSCGGRCHTQKKDKE